MVDAPDQSSPQTLSRPTPPGDTPEDISIGRRIFVRLAIAVLAVVFVLLVAVIYYKSWWKHPPVADAMLIVQGSAEVDGTAVTVEGLDDKAWTATISAEGQYVCRFHVPPGIYRVRVEFQGITINKTVELRSSEAVGLPLARLPELNR